MRTRLERIRAVGMVKTLAVHVREAGAVPPEFAEALANLNAACAQVAGRARRNAPPALATAPATALAEEGSADV